MSIETASPCATTFMKTDQYSFHRQIKTCFLEKRRRQTIVYQSKVLVRLCLEWGGL